MSKVKILCVMCLSVLAGTLYGVPVAIIDSGTDFQHSYFQGHLIEELDEAGNEVDDDGNGYVDDTFGWNFAEKNGVQVDYDMIPADFADYVKGLDILMTLNADLDVSAEDMSWIREKWLGPGNARFRTNISLTATFSHGTHVAGISLRESSMTANIMGLQIMPTIEFVLDEVADSEIPASVLLNDNNVEDQNDNSNGNGNSTEPEVTDEDFINLFKELAEKNSDSWTEEINMLSYRGAKVANCSFGFGFPQAKDLIMRLCILNNVECDADRVDRLARAFLEFYKRKDTERLIGTDTNIMFVVAAGNDGLDNDIYPDEPASYIADNMLTVASANHDSSSLAAFSNYGATTVDVVAPGEMVQSTYPQHLKGMMSGTSQAAPYVTGVVAQMLDVNPSLTPAMIKEIVIKTADKKEWLEGKVVSGGIVNRERALKAAELAVSMPLKETILFANLEVKDVPRMYYRAPKLSAERSKLFTPDMRNFVKEILSKARPTR